MGRNKKIHNSYLPPIKSQHAKVKHPENEENVIYRCSDYNANNDDYGQSDNNMECYNSSDDDDNLNDTSNVSENDDDKYQHTKHPKIIIEIKKIISKKQLATNYRKAKLNYTEQTLELYLKS